MDAETIRNLSESGIVSIAEFFSIAFIVICTYWGMHNLFNRLRPATKMLLSMFFGTIAYTMGKLVVLTFFFTQTPTPAF